MSKTRKNTIVFILVVALQLPYVVQWQHFVSSSHKLVNESAGYHFLNDNTTHCYLLHKIPFSFYKEPSFLHLPYITLVTTRQSDLFTRFKEGENPLNYFLRAPPVFHF